MRRRHNPRKEHRSGLTRLQQDREVDQDAEDEGGDAVGGKEGGVETGEVAGRDDEVLPDQHRQEKDAGGDTPEVREAGADEEQRDQHEFQQVDAGGDDHRPAAAETLRDGMQPLRPVDLLVGEGIQDVEAARPEEDDQAQQEDGRRNPPRHGDVSADRCDAERRPHPEMAEPGKTLQVAVSQQENQRQKRQAAAKRIDGPGHSDEQGGIDQGKDQRLPGRDAAGRNVAVRRARIARVDLPVGVAVEPHRRIAGEDHAAQDLQQQEPGEMLTRLP